MSVDDWITQKVIAAESSASSVTDDQWAEYYPAKRLPCAPPGWKIVGRQLIEPGEYFMTSHDARVWKSPDGDETAIYRGLFAYRVEPDIERPAPPVFEVLEYRKPVLGEWYVNPLDGGPVYLKRVSDQPDGPRWILERV